MRTLVTSRQVSGRPAERARRGPFVRAAPLSRTGVMRPDDELERMQRLYAALSRIGQAIVRTTSRDELFRQICETLVDQGGFQMAWIGWNDAATSRLVPVAVAGDREGYVDRVVISTDDRPAGRGPTGRAFREGRNYICNDRLTEPIMQPWYEESLRCGFLASASFPIREAGVVQGTLNVYSAQPGFFRDREEQLLSDAAVDISFALDHLAGERERRRVQARADDERRFSDTMIESLPGVLYCYDEQGRFLRWNRNFELVTGYSHDEIATMQPIDFFAADARAAAMERIEDVFQHGESQLEAQFVDRDGSERPYYFTGRRVELDGRRCLVGVGIDMSEIKEAELALRRSEQALTELNASLEQTVDERTRELRDALLRAEAADRVKSAFLATMSHELRTPLNSIIGFTGLVLQELAGPLTAEQTKQLSMVRASARHLLDLINDVLDLSKIEAGQLDVRHEPVDVHAVLERAVASVRPMADKKGLALAFEELDDVGVIAGDERRLGQILLNLLNNAIKFTEAGTVVLRSRQVGQVGGAARPGVQIEVEDTGIGIATADLGSLFQPFRQIDSGLTRQHDGTGLGLAICRRLATLLDGEITASSEVGRGSTFTLTLPIVTRSS